MSERVDTERLRALAAENNLHYWERIVASDGQASMVETDISPDVRALLAEHDRYREEIKAIAGQVGDEA